jgi:hypothetical protein
MSKDANLAVTDSAVTRQALGVVFSLLTASDSYHAQIRDGSIDALIGKRMVQATLAFGELAVADFDHSLWRADIGGYKFTLWENRRPYGRTEIATPCTDVDMMIFMSDDKREGIFDAHFAVRPDGFPAHGRPFSFQSGGSHYPEEVLAIYASLCHREPEIAKRLSAVKSSYNL